MKRYVLGISLFCFSMYGEYFNPLPIIETDHLILRNCAESDAVDLFQVHGDKEVVKYTPMEQDSDPDRTLYWIRWRLKRQSQNKPVPWVIEHKETKKVIGLCGFYTFDQVNSTASILITFNRTYDYSLIPEAIDAALNHGFKIMCLNRIDFFVHPEHATAIMICKHYEAKGLRKVGLIPDCLYYKGTFWDRIQFCMLKKDFIDRN